MMCHEREKSICCLFDRLKCVFFVFDFGKISYELEEKRNEYLCSRIDRRLWKGISLLGATIFNLIFALVLIFSILSFTQNNQRKDQFNEKSLNKLDLFSI